MPSVVGCRWRFAGSPTWNVWVIGIRESSGIRYG